MTSPAARWFRGLDARSVADAAVPTGLAVALGVLGGVAWGISLVVPIVAAIGALLLRGQSVPWAQEYGLAPFLLAVGALAILARPTLVTGVLAGVTGLSVLLWNARAPGEPARAGGSVDGLIYPGLGLGVALFAAIALPSANSAVGLAALALVVALALVLWSVGGALRATEPAPEAI